MRIAWRTRFTPWRPVDLSARTADRQAGSAGTGDLVGRILQPEFRLETGVDALDDATTVSPWGGGGDWRPWAIGAGILVAVGAGMIVYHATR